MFGTDLQIRSDSRNSLFIDQGVQSHHCQEKRRLRNQNKGEEEEEEEEEEGNSTYRNLRVKELHVEETAKNNRGTSGVL